MKRWVWSALLLLLLGAVINVAVAWGFATWSPLGESGTFALLGGVPAHASDLPSDIAARVPEPWLRCEDGELPNGFGLVRAEGLGISTASVVVFPVSTAGNTNDADHEVYIHWCGWPVRSMACAVWTVSWRSPLNPARADPPRWHGGFAAPPWLGPHGSDPLNQTPLARALPLYPVSPGFVLDSLFYAAVLAAPMGVLLLRRIWRIRTNRCPRCAYPAGAAPICAECGGPVRPRSVAAA